MKKTRFADTPTKRLLKLSGMSAKVSGKVIRHKVSSALGQAPDNDDLYSEVGEELVRGLGELKGAAMKVGQIASQLSHLLPDALADQLSQLQTYAEPMPYVVIEQQIRQSLGFTPEQLFKSFNKEPFAAASIGQVYRAVTHRGQEVVVKVQYPGVRRSCQSDLIQLKRLFKLSGLLKIDQESLNEVFDEIEKGLMDELDYSAEAKSITEFAQFHENNPNIIIPHVISDLSSEQVLTLSYEPGGKLEDILKPPYTQELRNRLAYNLMDAVLQEVLVYKKAHADPHPGNFAFRSNGQVVIYDYGLSADMSDLIIDKYLDLYEIAIDGEFERVDQILCDLKVRDESMSPIDPEIYRDWYESFFRPIFDNTDMPSILDELQRQVESHMSQFQSLRGEFKPCAETIFINRIMGGHLLNLSQMQIDIDLRPLFSSYLYEQ